MFTHVYRKQFGNKIVYGKLTLTLLMDTKTKECLNCGKSFEFIKDTAKYCKDSCKVMAGRKRGKSAQITPQNLVEMFEAIMSMIERIGIEVPVPEILKPFIKVSDPKLEYDADPITKIIYDELPKYLFPVEKKTFQQYMSEASTTTDPEGLRFQVKNSKLTPNQKSTVYSKFK